MLLQGDYIVSLFIIICILKLAMRRSEIFYKCSLLLTSSVKQHMFIPPPTQCFPLCFLIFKSHLSVCRDERDRLRAEGSLFCVIIQSQFLWYISGAVYGSRSDSSVQRAWRWSITVFQILNLQDIDRFQQIEKKISFFLFLLSLAWNRREATTVDLPHLLPVLLFIHFN